MKPDTGTVSRPSLNVTACKSHARRTLGELQNVLAGSDWLVGGKCTIADLAFTA